MGYILVAFAVPTVIVVWLLAHLGSKKATQSFLGLPGNQSYTHPARH